MVVRVVSIAGLDIGRLGAILKKTFKSEFNWEFTNVVFNKTFLDREGELDVVINSEEFMKKKKHLKELMKTIRGADFLILRWLDDASIRYLNLHKYVRPNNAIFKVHGTEARIGGIPENLIEWLTNWRYLPLTIVSCMDQTVIDNISVKSVCSIERPMDFDLVPTPRRSKNKLVLFSSPTKGPEKGIPQFREIVSKVKGLQTRVAENMSYDQCFKIRARSNIVFDQFFTGTYGMTAVEAWALKLPVLVGLKNWAYLYHPELADFAINVTPDTLYHELKEFVKDPKPYYEKGKKGYEYVKRVHDPVKIAIQYRALFETIKRQ